MNKRKAKILQIIFLTVFLVGVGVALLYDEPQSYAQGIILTIIFLASLASLFGLLGLLIKQREPAWSTEDATAWRNTRVEGKLRYLRRGFFVNFGFIFIGIAIALALYLSNDSARAPREELVSFLIVTVIGFIVSIILPLAIWNRNERDTKSLLIRLVAHDDQPVPADYDGDGKADFTVWRPTTGVWYSIKSSTSTYDYKTLGVPGDTAVPSSYIKQIDSQISGSNMAKLRLSPKNATGGTDLYSQNFSWGTSLVGLPGRAGLNAGFGMGYNSLVWIKDAANNAMIFDPDTSNISPGFRFGFPVIEPAYYDTDKAVWAYMMVSPSGGRTEFRQTSAGSTYETADSSYTRLTLKGATSPNDPVEDISITVSSTDGTKLSYSWIAGAFRCSQIKDRNGNYITIYHDPQGLLKKVTDTLGREINVLYDTELYPTSITQTWNANNGQGAATIHTWATFSYTNTGNPPINVNYGSMNVFGPPNGTSLKVLERVTYADSSSTKFEYNTYGQVVKIFNYAPDNHELNYVVTNLNSVSGVQTDCPRLTQTRSKIENFNGGVETIVNNTLATGVQVVDLDGATVAAAIIQVSLQNHPTGNVTNTYVGESGWMEALPIRTDDYANGNGLELKRSSWTKWTQEDNSLSYIKNPRVIESKVGDGSNLKRTTVEYLMQSGSSNITQFGLPSAINVYDSNQTTILKRSETDYNLVPTYTGKRIIGLPSESRQFGYENGSLNLVSKVTYGYDEENFSLESNQNLSNVIQHDNTAFSASFIAGRGNLNSTTRHDVTGATSPVTSKVRYDIAGSPVAQIDPMGRKVRIGYADAFNDNTNRNAYAYPTTLTDPAGTTLGDTAHSSMVKYRYDIGANVFATSPAPAGNTHGKISEREFDSLGRLSKDKINNYGGAYTRYEYPTNGIQSKVFSTIVDTNSNGADAADEVLSESWSDGAGRVRQSRTEHPGSIGGYSGSLVEYDILGRVKRQSVPTEIDASWSPAGDDATRGFLGTYQKYDWKGRVVRKINTDGTDSPTLNDSDVLISYEGCGCAGGLVTTVKGPVTTAVDVGGITQTTKRRTQKAYEDILGRTFKTEVWDLDGDGSAPYSTVKTWFNGRDQAVLTREYSGGDYSSTYQDTTATFDGHGRLITQHRPEQNAGTSTVYNYNADDSISNVTDARGAVTNYTYNNRRLPEQISYAVPQSSTIPVTPTVNFTYDNIGNRTRMTDGLGTVDYVYNELSQMTAETRDFNPSIGSLRLEYTYILSGQLKSYKDPYGLQINYSHDRIGRLSSVSGTSSSGNRNYANNADYRAWGALTHLDYGNGTEMNVGGFNNKLQATTFEVKRGTTQIINKQYEFFSDGMVKKETDSLNAKFDRLYQYDHAARLKEARTGAEARGLTDNALNIPYRNSYQYDAFGHQTQDVSKHFTNAGTVSHTYANNRLGFLTYDADGNALTDPDVSSKTYSYDAAGNMVQSDHQLCGVPYNPCLTDQEVFSYDGDGFLVKKYTSHQINAEPVEMQTSYSIRSSVMGGEVITEGNTTFVRANGTVVATHENQYGNVTWMHKDLNLKSLRSTDNTGQIVSYGDGSDDWQPHELDPKGKSVGFSDPYAYGVPDQEAPLFESGQSFSSLVGGRQTSYTIDGIQVPASHFGRMFDFAFGGIFGVVERQAQLSTLEIGRWVKTISWNETWGTDNADFTATNTHTVNRSFSYTTSVVYDQSWSMNLSLIPQAQQQTLAPLQEKKDTAIHNALKELTDFLKKGKFSENCQKNVIDKLNGITGFSMAKFIGFLELGGDFYDGTKSTALAKDYNPAYGFGPTKTIADSFRTTGSTQTNARTANGINTRFTVFFRPDEIETGEKKSRLTGAKISGITNDNLAFIFHEGLHGFGHYSKNNSLYDQDLQTAFGLSAEASINISKHIKKNCLENTD